MKKSKKKIFNSKKQTRKDGIVAARRTPIGKFFGSLARVPAPVLGSYAIKAALEDAPGAKEHVEACFMGNVLQAGLGQNPARQAGLKAGLADTLNAVTVRPVAATTVPLISTFCSRGAAGRSPMETFVVATSSTLTTESA